MSKKLRAVIVGFGKMGRTRAQSISANHNMELLALCDNNPEVNPPGMPVFRSYKELIRLKPDVVFVCTPNKYLPDVVCYFLNRGTHVFCEKPPGRCLSDVKRMLEAEKSNPGLKLKFGFNHRYHQAILEAKAIVDGGRLGEIMWMRGIYGKGGGHRYDHSWRNKKDISGGGILIDQGIHMVDLFRFFCSEFIEIKSLMQKSYWPVEVEDNCFALLKNRKGQIAMLHSSATQWQYTFLLDIYMKKGYITIFGILSSTKNYGTETLKIARCIYDKEGYPLPNPEETITYFEEDNSWNIELEEFIDCIFQNKPVKVGSCLEAYKTMSLIEKIYAADKSKEQRGMQKEKTFGEKSSLIK